MSSSLARVQNYAPADETQTMTRNLIQERGVCLDYSRSPLESARDQKELASQAVEPLRHQLGEAEHEEFVAINSFGAARKVVPDIQDTIIAHKALFDPIRLLPSETLCQIFECCTADDDHARNMRVAIRLSSVCRIWRLVAHSLGSLWRHIDYSIWKPPVDDIFKRFLDRSPYYLNVHVESDFDWRLMSSVAFSLTNFQFNRIRTLIINVTSGSLPNLPWPTIPISSNLTRLKICARLEFIPIQQGDCLRHCQNLEELELKDVEIFLCGNFVLPELARISISCPGRCSSNLFAGICIEPLLVRAPHLKSFSLLGAYFADLDMPLSGDNFQPLCELTSLLIEYPSSRHAMAPFLGDPSLTPSLQHLTLATIDGGDEPGLISDFNDLFVRHAETVSLTELTLEVFPYSRFAPGDDLVQRLTALHHFQYLERLEVVMKRPFDCWEGPYYSKYFITCLCKVLSECTAHPIFPSLRAVRFLRYAEASLDGVIEMVNARMAVAKASPEKLVPLESVTFEDCEPLSVDEYRRLEAAMGRHSS